MSNNKKAPAIRFKGFNDDWEERKLGSFTISYSGGTPKVGKLEYYGGDIPFIRSAEINSKNTELFITESGLNSSSAKMVNVGDILYALYGATSGEVGRSRICGAINQAILAIKPTESDDSEFIAQWLRGQKESIISTYLQGGQGNLSGNIVKDLSVSKPQNKAEQTQIGNFFRTLDHLITLQKRKCDKLILLKKAMLEQMFPKGKKSIPEIRFKGFNDDWEERKLGEVVDVTMGQSPNSQNYTDNPNYDILVQGNADMKDGRVSPRVWTTQVTKKAERNDLILSVRAPVGDIGRTDFDVVLGRGVAGIKGNEFIFQLLTKMKTCGYWRSLSTGSTFESINSNDIKKASVLIPSKSEQTQIGTFFRTLDNLITLQKRKLEKLKIIKKSMLDKMFI